MNTQLPMEEQTINDVVRAQPATIAVFASHGMDTCCGGGLQLRVAAERHGVPLDALLAELAACDSPAAPAAPAA